MRILYLTIHRLPTEKAYGIQISKMCEAFADAEANVTLVMPRRRNPSNKNIFDYYGIKNNFRVATLFSPALHFLGERLSFIAQNLITPLRLFLYVMARQADVVYSRDEFALCALSFFRKNLVFEAHNFSKKRTFVYRRFVASGIKIICISEGLKHEFVTFGFKPEKIRVAPDGVDLEKFSLDISKEGARKKVGLPMNRTIIMYTGQLYPWKGADTLAHAASSLPEHLFVFIGGLGKYLEDFRTTYGHQNNILIQGQRPHEEIPLFLKSADVLVLPNTSDEKISDRYTSPLKLFEYMASRRPIIASGIPSIREVLNEKNSVLYQAGDFESLVSSLKRVVGDRELEHRICRQANLDVTQYTWENRAEAIRNFFTNTPYLKG